MNAFLLAVRPDGGPIADAWRTRFLTAPCCRALDLEIAEGEGFWGFAGGDAAGRRPSIARHGSHVGIGTVRLDHPAEVRGQGGVRLREAADIERTVRAWPCDRRAIGALLGDFAFVLYDTTARTLCAARDAFGVDPLYYRVLSDMIVFGSHAEVLATGGAYDREFLAECLARVGHSSARTPYVAVSPVPPAHCARLVAGRIVVEPYWSAEAFRGPDMRPAEVLIEDFRDRFATAVRTRITSAPGTWAQLSGGLDSSSVVAMAATLARTGCSSSGLAGTITLIDRHGTGGDERSYSGAVVQTFGLRNEQLVDFAWWQDDGTEPPRTDQPTPAYLMYARDRRLATLVRNAGGQVLLSGYGSDQYLGGSAIFLADWVAQRRWSDALQQATRWAVTGRVSFWTFAFHNIVAPLLPGAATRRLLPMARVPAWINPRVVRELALEERTAVRAALAGARGRKYAASIHRSIDGMPEVLALHGVIQDIIEERHPFLYRPLVELGLGLAPELCAQPMARKWILREAMRGILPDIVRTRPGKGSIDGSLAWTLDRARARIQALLDHSMLADMDLIDPRSLGAAVAQAAHGADHIRADIVRTLALESWLQVRSGRWTRVGEQDRHRVQSS